MDPDESLVLRNLINEAARPAPDHGRLKFTIEEVSRRVDERLDRAISSDNSSPQRASVLSCLRLFLLLSELVDLERRESLDIPSGTAESESGRAAEDAQTDLASFLVQGITSGSLPYDLARYTLEAQHARPHLSSLLYNASSAIDRARFVFNMGVDGALGEGVAAAVLGAVEVEGQAGMAPSLIALLGPSCYSDIMKHLAKVSEEGGTVEDAANALGLLWTDGDGLAQVARYVKRIARNSCGCESLSAVVAMALTSSELSLEDLEMYVDIAMNQIDARKEGSERTESLCTLLRISLDTDNTEQRNRLKGVKDKIIAALGLKDDESDRGREGGTAEPTSPEQLSEQLGRLNGQAQSLRQLHEYKLIERDLQCDLCHKPAHFEAFGAADICEVHQCGHVFHQDCVNLLRAADPTSVSSRVAEAHPFSRAVATFFFDCKSDGILPDDGCLLCSDGVVMSANAPL